MFMKDDFNVLNKEKNVFNKKDAMRLQGALAGIREDIFPNRELSFWNVVDYFNKHQDDMPEIEKIAVLREAVDDGFLITQILLDEKNMPVIGEDGCPFGYKGKASKLEKRLLDLFGDEDFTVFWKRHAIS